MSGTAKDKQDKKSAPFPWTVGDDMSDYAALDADGWYVFKVAARFYDGEPRGDDARRMAERITEAVNVHDKLRDLLKRSLEFVAEWVAECQDQYKAWEGRESAGHARSLKADIDKGEAIFAEARKVLGEEVAG